MKPIPKKRIDYLIHYFNNRLAEKVCEDINSQKQKEALKKLYNSKTFMYLQDPKTFFFCKSEEELIYLLDKEYKNEWDTWRFQAKID